MGMSVASRLLREMPLETAMAELWVRAALPLVRPVPYAVHPKALQLIARVWVHDIGQ